MEKINLELKELCLEIIQSTSNNPEEWLKKTASVYEKLLVLDYLNQREKKLKSLEKKVKKKLDSVLQHETPKADPGKKKGFDINQTQIQLQQEVKILPHPEGPPLNVQHNIEESIIEIQKEETQKKTVSTIVEKPVEPAQKTEEVVEITEEPTSAKAKKQSIAEKAELGEHKKSLNEKLSGPIKIGLNDRIAFIKHLFNGQQEDFSRVLSQLNTFNDIEEVEQFIEHLVKPEYHWSDKEEYEERFMTIIRGKF